MTARSSAAPSTSVRVRRGMRARITAAVALLVAVPVTVGAVVSVQAIERSLRQDTKESTEDLAQRIQDEVAEGFFDPKELADGELAGLPVYLRDGDDLVTVSGELVSDPSGEFVILDGVSVESLEAELAYQAYDDCVSDELRAALDDEPDRVLIEDPAAYEKAFFQADDRCWELLPEAQFDEAIDEAFAAFDDCIDEAIERFGGFEEAFVRAEEECFELLPEEDEFDEFDESLEGFETVGFPIITTSGALSATTAGSLLEVERAVDAVRRSMWVAIPSLVLFIAVITWFTTDRALRPVGRITDRVRSITSTTLHERVPEPDSVDEIGELAVTMNEMLDRLEDSVAKQRAFVSDASHELRTPVATIRTELEVALRHPDQADWTEVAGSVLAEDARLERLVADLLLLARADEQAALGDRASVDLEDVVRVEAARTRRVPVRLTSVEPRTVPGRTEELRRLVAHLLDNAARHADSTIEVSLVGVPGGVRLRVDDDGSGVAPADRGLVFERFGRLDEGRARDTGGAGLGLAVVAATVQRHGGTVLVADAELGGARFDVVLPSG